MTGKTHRAGGALITIAGYMFLQSKGLTIRNANPYIEIISMYPFTLWGAVLSDLDQNKDCIPSNDILSRFANRLLHLTVNPYNNYMDKLRSDGYSPKEKREIRKSLGFKLSRLFNARHRSWQTHSDCTLIFLALLLFLINKNISQSWDILQLKMILTSVTLGMISHLILDSLTEEGIPLLIFRIINRTVLGGHKLQLPEVLHLVPPWSWFRCNGNWEKLVFWVLNISTMFLIGYYLVFVDRMRVAVFLYSCINDIITRGFA